MRKKQAKFITQAPAVGFKAVHPGKDKTFSRGPDLPPSGGSDGIESKFVRCKQCGFPIDTEKISEGNVLEGNITTRTVWPSTTNLSGASLGGTTSAGGSTTTYTTGQLAGRIIAPTKFGSAKWIVFYANPSAAMEVVGAIYRLSDGCLLGMTATKSISGSATWQILQVKYNPIELKKGEDVVVAVMGDNSWDFHYTGTGDGKYYAGTYFSGGTTDLTRADQIDGPPARVPAWTAAAGTWSMYVSSYKTITDTPAGFYSEVTGGCPLCGASNYK